MDFYAPPPPFFFLHLIIIIVSLCFFNSSFFELISGRGMEPFSVLTIVNSLLLNYHVLGELQKQAGIDWRKMKKSPRASEMVLQNKSQFYFMRKCIFFISNVTQFPMANNIRCEEDSLIVQGCFTYMLLWTSLHSNLEDMNR